MNNSINSYLVKFQSKSEAKRVISQGGVRFNGVRITDPYHTFFTKDFLDGKMLIEIGKKTKFILALIK